MDNKSEAMMDFHRRRNGEDWDWLLLKSHLRGDKVEKIMSST